MASSPSPIDEEGARALRSRAYICTFCSRKFSRREHVLRHELTHTGDKPYACDLCDNTFTRKDQLVRHKRTLHSQDDTDLSSPHGKPRRKKRRPNITKVAGSIPFPDSAKEGTQHLPFNGYNTSRFRVNLDREPDIAPQDLSEPLQTLPQDSILQDEAVISMPNSFSENLSVGTTDFEYIDEMQWFDTMDLDFDIFTGNRPWATSDIISSILSEPVERTSLANHAELTNFDLNPPGFNRTNWESADKDQDLDNTERALKSLTSRLLSSSTEGATLGPTPTVSEVSSLLFKSSQQFLSIPTLSPSIRSRLLQDMQPYEYLLPQGFRLPSPSALTRFLNATFNNFFQHFPFLHLRTWSADSCPTLLLLSMVALGTQYCFENSIGMSLYRVCRAMGLQPDLDDTSLTMERCQALLLLMVYGTWNIDKGILREALSLQSLLVQIVTKHGLSETTEAPQIMPSEETWHEWIHLEEIKRTKFALYSFLNVQSIAYNIPPALLNRDLNLTLPCSEAEWDAPSFQVWSQSHISTSAQTLHFQVALSRLLDDDKLKPHNDLEFEAIHCGSFASYCLVHAILQHIFYAHQLRSMPGTLGLIQVSAFVESLKRWQRLQQRNPESVTNPGRTLIFNGDSMLRLAYTRLNVDFSDARTALQSGDPHRVAQAIHRETPVERSRELLKAALHACIALRIPVKLGMKLVARTQVSVWNMQYLVCAFEYALLLSKWLSSVCSPSLSDDITSDEKILIQLVQDTLSEADMGSTEEDSSRSLPAHVLRVWATLFDDPCVWGIMPLMGASLRLYADML